MATAAWDTVLKLTCLVKLIIFSVNFIIKDIDLTILVQGGIDLRCVSHPTELYQLIV